MPLRAPRGFIDETDPKVCQVGHPAPPWVTAYADLMTELVCFFVILYALSASLNKDVRGAAEEADQMVQKGEIKAEVKVDKDGLKISLMEQGEVAFFGSGSADTTPGMEATMAKLAPVLKKLTKGHDIIVEGHSDNQRISNDYFDSNWELSTARATSVVRLLIDKHQFPPDHMGAIGYGEFRPIVKNDTPENRSKNRRVVFFVKSSPPPPGGGEKKKGASGKEAAPKDAPAPAPTPEVPAAPAEPAPEPAAPAEALAPAEPGKTE